MAKTIVHALLDDEKRAAMKANPTLTHEQAHWVAVAGLVALVVQAVAHIMPLAKVGTLTRADLVTYHQFIPWLSLIGNSLLIWTAHLKGVRYWLVYALSGLTISVNLVWLALFNGQLEPEQLSWLSHGPSWWVG